jgi:ABC-2 type transport system ATP-binding protein
MGARRDPDRLPADQTVIQQSHTDRQSTLLVHTTKPVLDPSWTVSDVGLEDLVLAYMATPSGGVAAAAPTLRSVG